MKIPFNEKFLPKIESGEYKVETKSGFPVKIIHCDGYGEAPILVTVDLGDGCGEQTRLYFADGKLYKVKSDADLFIVTPEPELSEFEKAVKNIYAGYLSNLDDSPKFIKKRSAELLSLAREQLIKDGYVIEKKAFHDAVEKVAPEVMKEVSDKVDMEEALRLEYERGKAEALKDLPRWKIWGNGAAGNSDGHPIALVSGAGGIRFVSVLGTTGEKYIMLADLKKLPGFKEDEK